MNFKSAFLALLSASAASAEALKVEVDVPVVIENLVPVPLELSLAGESVGSGAIEGVRTAVYTPTKRAPKFVANFTHDDVVVEENGQIYTTAVYSLPTKNYLLGYSVEVNYGEGESVWVDSDLVEVKVRDQQPAFAVLLAASLSVFGAFYALWVLCYFLASPGYFESSLPSSLHFVIPSYLKSTTEVKAKRA